MEKLKQALGFGNILSLEDIDNIIEHFRYCKLKSNEHLFKPYSVSDEVAFVEKGIVRVYTMDNDGNEITKYFVKENQFGVDLESYYTLKPSTDFFQTVVDSEIYSIKKSSMEQLSEQISNLYIFLKSITEAQLLNKIKDNDFLNFGDSKKKYLEFIKRYPQLALQVPQQHIASYLKITPQSLSRIRRNLAQKNNTEIKNKK